MDNLVIYIAIFVFGFSLDLVTKKIANEKLLMLRPVKLWGPFYFVLLHNTGAAYGFLKNRRGLLLLLSTISIILLIIIFLAALFLNYGILFLASLITIITGAIGNYTERVSGGKVTDFIFIKVKYFPVFNLADLFIFSGTIMLLIAANS
ncbi:MAG: signal peptidase II [Eubacteriaceae bacterium]|nr:signal peptidase II [Eubacteriaceae bacterium]